MPARAAVIVIVGQIDLTTIALLVPIAIGKARGAGSVAHAARARWGGDVVGGTDDAATAAVADVGRDVDLTAISLLVAVAVGETCGARAIANAAAAGRGDMTGGANRP